MPLWWATSGRLCLAEDGLLAKWDGERFRVLGWISDSPEVDPSDARDLRILEDEWANRDDSSDLRCEAMRTFYGGLGL